MIESKANKFTNFDEVKSECKNLDWKDISHESTRTYHYPDGSGVTINRPVALSLKEGSSGHRVIDEFRESHYIVGGWKHLTWLGFDGKLQYDF